VDAYNKFGEAKLNFETDTPISEFSFDSGGIYDWTAANIDTSSVYKIKDFGAGTDYRLMFSFASGNVCSPTAGANIMWYWHKQIGLESDHV